MAKEKTDRKCVCGETAEKHESKATQASSWRGKSLVEGSTCKRYKWAKTAETVKTETPAPAEAAA